IKDKFSVSVDEIIKMDINHNLFELTVDSGEKFSVPIKDCKNYSSNFCHYCRDLTAEYADISLGSIGSEEGWSTIIARTYEGEKLVKDAVKNESIEIKSFIGDSPVQSKIKIVADKKRKNSIPIEIPTVM
ncbi:MAG: Coenzyme F420 hydrogenase/dehydrogenase, beta subunit C-terminal domain, partial [Candidatus Thorarchaeota archaeon]